MAELDPAIAIQDVPAPQQGTAGSCPAMTTMLDLAGLSAFPVTPADATGRVDAAGLRTIVRRLAAAGVDSIGLLGSTGTYAYLVREERRRAIEAALAEAGATPVLVGVGALRTDEAVRLAEDARAAGAAAGLLAPVSYTPLLDEEVYRHFAAVAAAGLPLCIYDNPSTTHFSFSPTLVGRLSRLDGVVALKIGARPAAEAAGQFAELRGAARPGFSIGCSVDLSAHEGMLAGFETWYSVIGGTLPRAALAITRAAQAGDAAEARRLHATLEPIWETFRNHSSIRVVHTLSELLGLPRAEPPRPILPLRDAARAEVAAALESLPAEMRA